MRLKAHSSQMEVEKNEKRRRKKIVDGGEKQGSTGARQRWQAVKVAVTL